MQGDKIFDSLDYNVLSRLASISIVSFLFVVQFDVLCLQLIYDYFSLTDLNYPNKRKRLKCHCLWKIPLDMFLNKGMFGLLSVKYKITVPFCLSLWIVKNLYLERPFVGMEIFSIFHGFHGTTCLGFNFSIKTLREDAITYNVAWINTLL